MMFRFFQRFRKPDLAPEIAAEKTLIKACTKAIRWKGSHPMARYFAGLRRDQAQDRLRALEAGQDRADANAALRKSVRQRGQQDRSPFDLFLPGQASQKAKPIGTVMPDLPSAQSGSSAPLSRLR
ncbi:hypothetical protein ACWIEX_06000 [Bosea sp. NPDC055353]